MEPWNKNSNGNSYIYSGVQKLWTWENIGKREAKLSEETAFYISWFEYFRKFPGWPSFFHPIADVSPLFTDEVEKDSKEVPANLSTLVFLFDWLEALLKRNT